LVIGHWQEWSLGYTSVHPLASGINADAVVADIQRWGILVAYVTWPTILLDLHPVWNRHVACTTCVWSLRDV